MPRLGFESTIQVFKRPETVRASDRSATGVGTARNETSKSEKFSNSRQERLFRDSNSGPYKYKASCLYCQKMVPNLL
jgi:hypothetical protein